MSNAASLHFPDAGTITQYLSNHPSLKGVYFEENGITKAVAELAAKRFADREIIEAGVKMGVAWLIHDLQTGVDGLTGEALPKLRKLELPPVVWSVISSVTEIALVDCANSRLVAKL